MSGGLSETGETQAHALERLYGVLDTALRPLTLYLTPGAFPAAGRTDTAATLGEIIGALRHGKALVGRDITALRQPPGPPGSLLGDLFAAAKALEAAEDFHANCAMCEGTGIAELCPACFPLFDDARVKRRAAIARAEA